MLQADETLLKQSRKKAAQNEELAAILCGPVTSDKKKCETLLKQSKKKAAQDQSCYLKFNILKTTDDSEAMFGKTTSLTRPDLLGMCYLEKWCQAKQHD